jgi:predicted DCC family thiol-disulfide oxidoreductase YuxK
MTRLRKAWAQFWFTPDSPTNLGACRILFYAGFFLYYFPLDVGPWADVSAVFWMPIALFEHLRLPVLSRDALTVLEAAWKMTLLLSCAGLYTRTSTGLAAVLGLYLLALPQNFGKVHHNDALVVFVLIILALSRCGDALSLDRLIRQWREATPARRTLVSGEYRWPIRAVWMMFAFVLCAAGIAKLRRSGLAWATSDNLAILLIQHNYRIADMDPVVPWGLEIARYPWLVRGMAASTLIVETLFPLALVSRLARWLLVPSAFFMLLGIRLSMGPAFVPFLICFLFWVDWRRLGAALASMLGHGSAAPVAVLFDGGCSMCRRTVAVLSYLDCFRQLEFHDVAAAWPGADRRFVTLTRVQCLNEFHVVPAGAAPLTGFDAYRAMAWKLPLLWPLLPLVYLPGARRVGRFVYATVSARRCEGACQLRGEVPPDAAHTQPVGRTGG